MGSSKSKVKAKGGGQSKLMSFILAMEWSQANRRLLQCPQECWRWASIELYGCTRRVLPIHVACVLRPPATVVEALLDVYPLGAEKCSVSETVQENASVGAGDGEDWLPLQIAIHFFASPEVIEALLSVFPKAAFYRNRAYRLPIHTACRRRLEKCHWDGIDTKEILEKLLEAYPACAKAESDDGSTPLDYLEQYNPPGFTKIPAIKEVKDSIVQVLENKGDRRKVGRLHIRRPSKMNFKALNDVPDPLSRSFIPSKYSKLYDFVSTSQWDKAIARCKKNPNEASMWIKDDNYDFPRLPIMKVCGKNAPVELINSLIEAYPEGVQCRENHAMLPIHICIQKKANEDILRSLIRAHPASVWAEDAFGLLPIHLAITEGATLRIVEILLMNAPDSMYAPDKKGYTALHYAEMSLNPNKSSVWEALNTSPVIWKSAFLQSQFAGNGSTEANKSLYNLICARDWESSFVRCKTHPVEAKLWFKDETDGYGRLPIHKCILLKPTLKVVQAICKAYTDGVYMREKNDMTPLLLAIETRVSEDIIQYLIREFPECSDISDSLGRVPLCLAIIHDISLKCIGMLIQASPQSVNSEDIEGNSALWYAEQGNHPERKLLMEMLLEDYEDWDQSLQEQVEESLSEKDNFVNFYSSGWNVSPAERSKVNHGISKSSSKSYLQISDHSCTLTTKSSSIDDKEVSGRRLAKLKAIRQKPKVDAAPKVTKIVRRGRPQKPLTPIQMSIPEENEDEFETSLKGTYDHISSEQNLHREHTDVNSILVSEEQNPRRENIDETSIEVSELTTPIDSETRKPDLENAIAEVSANANNEKLRQAQATFLLSDWRVASAILDGELTGKNYRAKS